MGNKGGREAKKGHKVLVLGVSDSGKTTLVRQWRLANGLFDLEARNAVRTSIRTWTIEYLKLIVEWIAIKGPAASLKNALEDSVFAEIVEFQTRPLTVDIASRIQELWALPAVQEAWTEHRSKIQVPDSLQYFICKFPDIAGDYYVPTDEDVILSYARTEDPSTDVFQVDGHHFEVIEYGGEPCNYKNSYKLFPDTVAIVFLVGLGDYDQTFWWNDRFNRMKQSIGTWTEFVSGDFLAGKLFFLVLNKEDKLKEKLKRVPLTETFPEYTGKSFENALAFLKKEFLSKVEGKKPVSTHVINATIPSSAMTVFDDVKKKIASRLAPDDAEAKV